ncbi:MAG TPA: DEAD/DEAH box helicase, partial [Terriglobales bacterium]|nr:DEAD/DEAH box helicase [Terriglobales bacterium]
RMRSDDLLASVFPDVAACQENIVGDIQIPNHPLVNEVMKDVLTEAMDIDGLKRILRDMNEGRVRCVAVDTPVPSQFSHEILNANPYAYLDDAPLEERRARAVEMRRILPESVLEEVGKLDPAAIAQVREEAWPDVRDADELHDMLHTLIALPEDILAQPILAQSAAEPLLSAALALVEENHQASLDRTAPSTPLRAVLGGRPYANLADWRVHFERLIERKRAGRAQRDGRSYWVAAERVQSFAVLFPNATFEQELPKIEMGIATREDALLAMLNGWMTHLGPTTASELGNLLGLPSSEIEKALLRLEASGAILRGKFTDSHTGEIEWCERRLLARIHRLTVATLRKQIEPVTPAQFMRWLLRWQHVAPGTQVLGERGLLDVLRQLQGFEIPASAWERHILARRVANYDPKWLDQLCLTGAVGWGRLSPHPATLEDSNTGKRRVIPTSVAPVTFFVREDADWMAQHNSAADQPEARGLSHGAQQVLDFLRQRGASFFADIVRGTGKLKAEIETALWELVAAGLVTA